MDYTQEQIDELKMIAPNLSITQEGGYTYFLLEKLKMPENCLPKEVDALLCPSVHSGYNSRLFFSEKITGCKPNLNWNGVARVLGRNWVSISWNVPPDQGLAATLLIHLKAFRL